MNLAEVSLNPWRSYGGKYFNRIGRELIQSPEPCFDGVRIERESALNSNQALFARRPKHLIMGGHNAGGATKGQIFGINGLAG